MKEQDITEHVRLLKVMAHPTRLRILRELTEGTKCVNDMCELLDAPQPNVSQHLAALKQAGLVVSEKQGALRCYELANPRLLKSLFTLLDKEVRADKTSPRRYTSPHADCEAHICLKHDIEIDGHNPRCPHPSSRCRFRELCPVMEAAKALAKEPK